MSDIEKEITDIRQSMAETHVSLINHSLEWRSNALRTVRKMLTDNSKEICEVMQKDLGRGTSSESLVGEIIPCLNEITNALKNLPKWMKPIPRRTPLYCAPMETELRSVPLLSPGVVIIGAFNFPILLTIMPAIGALLGGNPVLLKPSEIAEHTSQLLECLVNSYFDKSVFHVIQGGAEVVTGLLKYPWGKVCFTGSERVGKIIAKSCAETLTPVILELGGKCPVYIESDLPDYKLKIMAKRIIWGKSFNSGQACVAPDYLLCKKDILEKLVAYMREGISEMYGKNIAQSQFARCISRAHAKRLISMIEEVEAVEDTKIVLGGAKQSNVADKFVTPTIVVNPPLESTMMREEIFGPILPIIVVKSEEEAIDIIQKMKGTPLALYIFSSSKTQYNRMIKACPAANTMMNETLFTFNLNDAPIGGVGTSGMGKYKGKFSFDTFTNTIPSTTHACVSISDQFFSLRYPPYKGIKRKFIIFAYKFFPDIYQGFYIKVLLLFIAAAVVSQMTEREIFWQPLCLGLANFFHKISVGFKRMA